MATPTNDPPTVAFLGLDTEADRYENASTVVLPVPFERTTSYGQGTRFGPEAILRASQYVELYDEELRSEPAAAGIATVAPFVPESFDMAARRCTRSRTRRGGTWRRASTSSSWAASTA